MPGRGTCSMTFDLIFLARRASGKSRVAIEMHSTGIALSNLLIVLSPLGTQQLTGLMLDHGWICGPPGSKADRRALHIRSSYLQPESGLLLRFRLCWSDDARIQRCLEMRQIIVTE